MKIVLGTIESDVKAWDIKALSWNDLNVLKNALTFMGEECGENYEAAENLLIKLDRAIQEAKR